MVSSVNTLSERSRLVCSSTLITFWIIHWRSLNVGCGCYALLKTLSLPKIFQLVQFHRTPEDREESPAIRQQQIVRATYLLVGGIIPCLIWLLNCTVCGIGVKIFINNQDILFVQTCFDATLHRPHLHGQSCDKSCSCCFLHKNGERHMVALWTPLFLHATFELSKNPELTSLARGSNKWYITCP